MARLEPELIVTLSVLDRLSDEEPNVPTDPAITRAQSLRAFKANVRRDLEWLLNTRTIAVPPPAELAEVNRSLYVYGLPDAAACSPDRVRDRELLLDGLRNAVRLFESRMYDVEVSYEPSAVNSRTLRFRIDGLARMDPAPERITFDTLLELTNGEYEVK